MSKKVLPLNNEEIEMVDGKPYLMGEVKDISKRKKSKLLYFAKTAVATIYHDSPVMGAYEIGDKKDVKIEGPFGTKEEAEKLIGERKKQIDGTGYEFYGEVIPKIFSEDLISGDGSIKLFRLYKTFRKRDTQCSWIYRPQKGSYKERLESFLRDSLNPEIDRIRKESIRFEEKKIKTGHFNGFEIIAVTENGAGQTFSELSFNEIAQAHDNVPPFAYIGEDGKEEIAGYYLDKYFGPRMTINSISDHVFGEKLSEILLLNQIDFVKAFDSGCKSLDKLLELNRKKIIA